MRPRLNEVEQILVQYVRDAEAFAQLFNISRQQLETDEALGALFFVWIATGKPRATS